MTFLLCNRCNKKSDDNIVNLNSSEIIIDNKKPNYTNTDTFNMINQAATNEKFLPLDDLNININNLEEEDDDDDLKIIEYPYKLIEKKIKSVSNKLKPKEFKKNKSKFNEDDNLVEKDIINKLNYIDKTTQQNNKQNKNCLISSHINYNSNNDKTVERKDTIKDPSNLALSSLIFEINKNQINKNKSKVYNEEINNDEKNNISNNMDKINNKNSNNHQTKNMKYSKKVQRKQYSNNIIKKKKNLLKIQNISNNISNRNKLVKSNLVINTKKNFPKSFSFNCFEINKENSKRIKTEYSNNNKHCLNLNSQNKKKVRTAIFSPQNKNINKNKDKFKIYKEMK